MFDRNLLTVYAHDVNDIFKNVEHNRAFQEWLKSISDKKTPMNHDFIVNIRAAQERPMTGPVGSGRAFTYREYFGKAAWVKDMPPIDQFQIIPDDPAYLTIEKTRDFSEDSVRPRKDWTKSVAESTTSMPRKDWSQVVAGPAKDIPKKDWTQSTPGPKEFKTLPPRKPSFDRDR